MPSIVAIPVRAFTDKRLKKTDLGVLASIYQRTDKNGYCWPSYRRIAEDSNCSRRTAIYSVGRLVSCGYLVKVDRTIPNTKGEGKDTSNGFYINFNPVDK